jgi:hypothetical protein
MALTLVETPGATNANTYATLAEAEDLVLAMAFPGTWGTATTAQKNAALTTAARRLDTLTWKGTRSSLTQALAWPRAGVVDRDGFGLDGTTIPARLKAAQVELAVRELAEDRGADPVAGAPQRVKLGSLEVDYGSGARRVPPGVTSTVEAMLADLLLGGSGSVLLVRS